MRGLIGYSGFVGSNLDRQGAFDALFNSKNFQALAGQAFDEIWCAGVQASKWWANQNPEADWNAIDSLLGVLKTVKADRFVLISTVDVFKSPIAVDERTLPDRHGLHAYGLHRLRVEDMVKERFPRHLVVRLPGLYGRGLRKNVIYDFLHGNNLASIHADAVFQFYDLSRLTSDIAVASAADVDLIHLTTEPVSVAEVAAYAFDLVFQNRPTPAAPRYDLNTVHARLWDREGPYLESGAEVLRGIRSFVAAMRQVERI